MAVAARKPGRTCALRRCRNPVRKPWPRRHGWRASDVDIQLASAAQSELVTWRQQVILVPANPEHPQTRRGQKVRVRQDDGPPRWYAELLARRHHRNKHSIRKYVENSLAHLCATGYIRPNAITIEVLDALYEFNDPRMWGYRPSESWALRLKRNPYADRYRKHRRARDSQRGNHEPPREGTP